jgi:protein-arginine kinase activator protein McsA
MLVVRCKECSTELTSTTKTQVCGCANMMTVVNDSVTAFDLSKVVMLNAPAKKEKKNVLEKEDILWQENRRKRKVKRLNFDIR